MRDWGFREGSLEPVKTVGCRFLPAQQPQTHGNGQREREGAAATLFWGSKDWRGTDEERTLWRLKAGMNWDMILISLLIHFQSLYIPSLSSTMMSWICEVAFKPGKFAAGQQWFTFSPLIATLFWNLAFLSSNLHPSTREWYDWFAEFVPLPAFL